MEINVQQHDVTQHRESIRKSRLQHGYHPDVSHGQHDRQGELEEGVTVERAEVGQREEADGRHQVDLRRGENC